MAKSAQTTQTACPRCAAADQALQDRYAELAKLQKLYVRLESQNQKLSGQLQQERSARKASETQLAKLRASTFWRMTAPLRAIVQKLRR